MSPTRRDKLLVVLVRFVGVFALFALFAVVMPVSWMAGVHRWLGLGELPTTPVVEYLARSVSAFYALFGAFCLFLARDLRRYREAVRFLGGLAIVFGLGFVGIDAAAGMPWWWTVLEGPPTIAFGAVVFFLARGDNETDSLAAPSRDTVSKAAKNP